MPFIEYELNKKYIAEVLCENKDKPEMHCNGKCHLKKQLKKANSAPEQQEQPQAPPPFKSDPVITILLLPDKHSFYGQKCTKVIIPYIIHYSFEFASSIFHPPKNTFAISFSN
jgi:hypothetical protein